MSRYSSPGAGTPSEFDALVLRLSEISKAIAHARSLGVPAPVPSSLYEVCVMLVAQHDEPSGGDRGPTPHMDRSTTARDDIAGETTAHSLVENAASRAVRSQREDELARKMPLRRLLWHVIKPGEEFTVTDVTARLDALGVSWSAGKVSNALGYWVSRGRLNRCRKGVYQYPTDPIVDDVDDVVLRESPTGLSGRVPQRAGRKESLSDDSPTQTRQAM